MPILPRRLLNSLLYQIKGFVDRHPHVLARLRALVYWLRLEDAARKIYARLAGPALYLESFRQNPRLPRHTDYLSPHARQIYQDIKAAIETQHKSHV